MAGPSIAVRVIGDLKGLSQAVDAAASKAGTAAGKLKTAFTGALGAINQTGVLGPFSDAIAGVDTALTQLGEHGKGVGIAMTGVGATMAGVGVGLAALGSKEKASQDQLKSAVEATGASYDDYAERIEKAAKHNEHFGITSHQTNDALRILTQATGSTDEALKLMGTATDLAAAKHEDLGTAATQLGRAYNGSNKIFKEFGITVDKTGNKSVNAQVAIAKLGGKLSGQADAAANTFSGHMKAVGATVEDAAAKFGEKFGPAITVGGTALAALGSIMTGVQATMGLFKSSQEAAAVATDALTASEDAAAVSEGLALAPILLIVLAVGALIAIGVVLYKNWDTIWNGIQTVISTVWDWIKTNWPLLLVILTGPIGAAVLLIVKHWNTIWDAIKAVWNWIKTVWGLIYQWLIQPYIDAVKFIIDKLNALWDAIKAVWNWIRDNFSKIYDWIKKPFGDAVDWVKDKWDGFWDTFKRGIGVLKHDFAGMWDGIKDAFRSAINFIIDGWNSIQFKIPGFSLGPVHFGGFTLGLPDIPRLAQGGIVTSPTLALIGESGPEAVVPLGRRTTPAVWIEHATFKETLDVDEFMRQAAWHIHRERI